MFYNQLLTMQEDTPFDRVNLASQLSALDQHYLQYVYLIISLYVAQTGINDLSSLSIGNKKIKYNLNTFPDGLCILLQRFVNYLSN
jgi:hypothetical protein